jgi:hypothetical protein
VFPRNDDRNNKSKYPNKPRYKNKESKTIDRNIAPRFSPQKIMLVDSGTVNDSSGSASSAFAIRLWHSPRL